MVRKDFVEFGRASLFKGLKNSSKGLNTIRAIKRNRYLYITMVGKEVLLQDLPESNMTKNLFRYKCQINGFASICNNTSLLISLIA